MKKILSLLLAVILSTTSIQADDMDATLFVKDLADNIITNVLSSSDTMAQKSEKFNKYFLDALDVKSIGQFVLGKRWRRLTKEQQNAFLDAFIDMALKSWADKFNLYTGQKITFTGTRPAQGDEQVFVDSVIQDKTPVDVIWRVKRSETGLKIVDIIIEGVSMCLSYRNEYVSYLQNHTIEELIQTLSSQAKSFKFTN